MSNNIINGNYFKQNPEKVLADATKGTDANGNYYLKYIGSPNAIEQIPGYSPVLFDMHTGKDIKRVGVCCIGANEAGKGAAIHAAILSAQNTIHPIAITPNIEEAFNRAQNQKFESGGEIKTEDYKGKFQGLTYSYKNQHELNLAIKDFITRQQLTGRTEYSNDIKEFIYKYEGSGGLIKQGASGVGVLYEYYTPKILIEKMWGLAYKYGFRAGKILEPSVGIGRVLDYANPKTSQITAYEIDQTSRDICEIMHPGAIVNFDSFSQHFYNGNSYNSNYDREFDLVIGNPPYGEFLDLRKYAEEKRLTKGMRYEHYFIIRGLDVLKKGGLLIYVSTANLFLKNYEKVKSEILKRGELLEAYLLPNSTFKRTSINTSLIVLKKK